MKLLEVRVQNFRNLPDISIQLDPLVNYLIGENNIGKSNLVAALEKFLTGGAIDDDDYLDPALPIRLELTFDQGAPGGQARPFRAACEKALMDARISCFDLDSGAAIDPARLRGVNLIRSDAGASGAEQAPQEAANLGALLIHLMRRQLQGHGAQPGGQGVDELLGTLNEQLSRIKAFGDFGLHADLASAQDGMLPRLVYLLDASALPVDRGSAGVQASAMAMMAVINRILALYYSRTTPLDRLVRHIPDGRRVLPMIFALDEPENHLHPYRQRSLIRYYKRIMANEDAPFLELLKSCFDLDGLDGQLLIITHSTDALVDNFRNLIRFYKDFDHRTRTASGAAMQIAPDIEKHLIMQFPDIKEAFYARCAILVEGATESSAVRQFAQTLRVAVDDHGICIIDAGGEGALRKLESLLSRFGIPCVLVFDGDVRPGGRTRANEFYTETACFETEIAATLIARGEFDTLEGIPPQIEADAMQKKLTYASLEMALTKFGAEHTRVPRSLAALKRGTIQYGVIYAAWLYRNKGAILGRVIGGALAAQSIPACYRDAILRARAISEGAARTE